jgi:hypothetical protein
LNNWSVRRWLFVVLVVAVFVRLGLWSVYPLTQNNDSPTYIQLGKSLLKSGFANYSATRPPGYPAFLALAGEWTYFAQLCLGLLATLLFFYIGWKLSHRAWFAGLAALLHTLNIGQLFFEATLLTETLTTFLVTLTLAGGLFVWQQEDMRWRLAGVLIAGLSAALAGITRPLFVFLPFLLALFLLLIESKFTRRWLLALVSVLPALLIFGGWLNFVDNHYKILSFDTIGGYRWLNHTGEYFEYVPDQYADLRSTYIYYRDQKITETGTQTNAAWDALPEMQEASGLGYFGLSRLLTDISMDLIRTHPDLYLKNVLSGWWMFWWAAVYWSTQALKTPWLGPWLDMLIAIERGMLILGNFLFLAASVLAVFWKKIRERLGMNPFLWLGVASIWSASIFQTLLDHGDNPRYLVPLQSLVVLISLYWLLQLVSSLKRTGAAPTSKDLELLQ